MPVVHRETGQFAILQAPVAHGPGVMLKNMPEFRQYVEKLTEVKDFTISRDSFPK